MYEIYAAEATLVLPIIELVTRTFGYTAELAVEWLDVLDYTCYCGDMTLTIGWDNWSGCFVMARTEPGDALVRTIGAFLDTQLPLLAQL